MQLMGGKEQVEYWPEDNDAYIRAKWFKEGYGRAYLGYTEAMSNMGDYTNNLDFKVISYCKEDKITTEKQEFNKCLFENEKFENEKYYVIRAGYYYITSLLQLKHIKKFEKVIFQDDLIKLSKVRMFYKDFKKWRKSNLHIFVFPKHDHDLNYLQYILTGNIPHGLQSVFDIAHSFCKTV